jgi:hypothetical protein
MRKYNTRVELAHACKYRFKCSIARTAIDVGIYGLWIFV